MPTIQTITDGFRKHDGKVATCYVQWWKVPAAGAEIYALSWWMVMPEHGTWTYRGEQNRHPHPTNSKVVAATVLEQMATYAMRELVEADEEIAPTFKPHAWPTMRRDPERKITSH